MNIITLPLPPSVNGLYAGKSRRYKSKKYVAWIKQAGWQLMAQRPLPQIKGKVIIHMKFGRPDRRKRDVANLEKATSDLLVAYGIIQDDSLIEKLILEWWPDVVGAQIEIEAI